MVPSKAGIRNSTGGTSNNGRPSTEITGTFSRCLLLLYFFCQRAQLLRAVLQQLTHLSVHLIEGERQTRGVESSNGQSGKQRITKCLTPHMEIKHQSLSVKHRYAGTTASSINVDHPVLLQLVLTGAVLDPSFGSPYSLRPSSSPLGQISSVA